MLSKQNSLQIKGIAILCMIIFHLFGFPNRLPEIIHIDWFGSPITKAFQICVPIYLFMAGFGLQCTYQNRNTKWNDILNRIKKTYKFFWWVAIPFIILGTIAGYYHIDTLGGGDRTGFKYFWYQKYIQWRVVVLFALYRTPLIILFH